MPRRRIGTGWCSPRNSAIALPKPPAVDPRVDQASIIIEDDSLTEPEFRREDVLRAMAEHARPRVEEVPAPVVAPPPSVRVAPPPCGVRPTPKPLKRNRS